MIVAGCLPERFGEDIAEALPEVDFFLGTGAYDKIVQAVENSFRTSNAASELTLKCLLPDPNLMPFQNDIIPKAQSSSHMAYIKIAEGCGRHCTYCIIPRLRGRHRSRPVGDVVKEARTLVASGVKELILVSQDTTYYGADLNPSVGLSELLEEINGISDDIWIRCLYGQPESIDDRTIEMITRQPNICSYFDIPIQHASDHTLKQMGRHYSRDDLYKLFEKIRKSDPGACIRTTVITGFPNETEDDFQALFDFIKEVRFDHLGVFTYSDSEDLPSHRLPNHVPEEIARERSDCIMSVQADVSLENNGKYIGRNLKVLVENESEGGFFEGRTVFQAPEVDGITYIRNDNLIIGEFAQVKISEASDYDLTGVVV